jgi:hypothetical protein
MIRLSCAWLHAMNTLSIHQKILQLVYADVCGYIPWFCFANINSWYDPYPLISTFDAYGLTQHDFAWHSSIDDRALCMLMYVVTRQDTSTPMIQLSYVRCVWLCPTTLRGILQQEDWSMLTRVAYTPWLCLAYSNRWQWSMPWFCFAHSNRDDMMNAVLSLRIQQQMIRWMRAITRHKFAEQTWTEDSTMSMVWLDRWE